MEKWGQKILWFDSVYLFIGQICFYKSCILFLSGLEINTETELIPENLKPLRWWWELSEARINTFSCILSTFWCWWDRERKTLFQIPCVWRKDSTWSLSPVWVSIAYSRSCPIVRMDHFTSHPTFPFNSWPLWGQVTLKDGISIIMF